MAAPRAARALLWPAQRAKILPRRPLQPHMAVRTKSSSAEEEADSNWEEGRSPAATRKPGLQAESDGTPLGQQLAELGIPPEEYKQLWKSKQAAKREMADWQPRTREEAQLRWKQMQTTPDHLTLLHTFKQGGVDPIELAKKRGITLPTDKPKLDAETTAALEKLRSPINVKAVHLRPLRRAPEYGVPVCDLQLRSFSIRNLLLFADFAVRAAYYMALPARGPVPLPRMIERWTVPRANFVNKKSQENFERITMRRLIQIQDGHTDVVKAWLAFLEKHQYHGVAMKANIWEYESLEAATRAGQKIEDGDYSRRRDGPVLQKIEEILGRKVFSEQGKEAENNIELRR